MSKFKYLSVLTLPILAYVSFRSYGWMTYLPVIESFVLIPLLELLFKPNPENLSEAEEEFRKRDRVYDWQIYLMVPVQFALLFLFLLSMGEAGLSLSDKIGRITGMGMLCGVIGINVAHELGHRSKKYEQNMAKMLLLTSLYMHFFIEHNRGHHKNVSTKEDPSSARYKEMLFVFWFRSVFYSYISAWRIELARLKKNNNSFFSFHNEMLVFQLIQAGLLILIGVFFSWEIMGYFIASATIGFLLLETVNYIEHYGLERIKKGEVYERVMPHHSWNSDHIVGRLLLFELSRHSDHHYIASRKYQILRHMDKSPQMPTGYPGMMLLATLPPLWFAVMNPRIKRIKEEEIKMAA
ncbi:MAG: alkane 1-monooxygenase [Cyclobacteriaceae bacterium]